MSINLLVVDDSAVMRKFLIRNLRMCGLPLGDIHEAGDGAEALQKLPAIQIHLVLADINMPLMDGEKMFRTLRNDPVRSSLPFIFISSESSAGRVESLMKEGALFIHKPFSPEMIRDAITALLGEDLGA